jgi:cobalt-precorrin-5B (C1)-methyltransferase
VGTVTREGLALAVGEPAINPVPRRMIREHLAAVAAELGYDGGFRVTVGVEDGAELAQKTMNPRLGILGGLSILGTTGIVRPFSCAAYIASIRQGIDVARSNGITHIAACTGSASEAGIRSRYDLPDMALIEMGDFVGAVLKHLRKAPVARLSIAGGFGKLTKMAAGAMDLHSRSSSVDFGFLATEAAACGGDGALAERIRGCNTSMEALAAAREVGLPLAERICEAARLRAADAVGEAVAVDVWAFGRDGAVLGSAGAS